MQLKQGTLLQGGKYKIDKVLGQGGFGVTYLAEQTMLGRLVAVKEFFMKEYCNRDEITSYVSVPSEGSVNIVLRFKDKFLKEARMIASMDSNHIVRIYDIFEENGTAYYIMENIDGGSVADFVKDGPLSKVKAVKIINDVAEALNYIHKQSILHLDIKPSNILLRKNGDAVIIDFGISKRYDETGSQTSSTPIGLSKGYAPIEQYNQGLQNFSPSTDIYSLGATLYKLITGITPPEASILLNDEDALIRFDEMDENMWQLIRKSMEPRCKNRPQDISSFLQLLNMQTKCNTDVRNIETEEPDVTVVVQNSTTVTDNIIASNLTSDNEGNIILNIGDYRFKMVHVEKGKFIMGEKHFFGFAFHDNQAHEVILTKDYFVSEIPVTQDFYEMIMGINPSKFKGNKLPVESVSWYDCQNFINKLNTLLGNNQLKFRLPTEAEWEYAAIGGNKNKNCAKTDEYDLGKYAWYYGNSEKKTHPIMKRKPNFLGLYDILGNVNEWCQDTYGDYSSGTSIDPCNDLNTKQKVNRGGSYDDSSSNESHRNCTQGESKLSTIGFRLVMS